MIFLFILFCLLMKFSMPKGSACSDEAGVSARQRETIKDCWFCCLKGDESGLSLTCRKNYTVKIQRKYRILNKE